MAKDQTVLFIGTIDQVEHVTTNRQLLGKHESLSLRTCSLLENILMAIRGSDSPANRNTWNLPSAVYYTGQIGASGSHPDFGKTVETVIDNPLLVCNYVTMNGLTPIHLPLPYSGDEERILKPEP
ncbi:MAG: hypothetical protein AABX10_03045 [Nanoarchaeota archaeon]